MVEDRRAAAVERWRTARGLFDKVDRGANLEARRLLNEALDLDPGFARATGHLSYTYVRGFLYGWDPDVEEALQTADRLASDALRADPEDYDNHWSLGIVRLYQKRFEEAERHYAEAERRLPDDDPARPILLAETAELLVALDRAPEAAARAEEAIRLAGADAPAWFRWNLGYARLMAGDAAGAVEALEAIEGPDQSSLQLMDLALAYDLRAREEDERHARDAVARCLPRDECRLDVAVRQPLPDVAEVLPRDLYLDALRRLGVK